MAQHNDLGKEGEDIATEFLIRKGYIIRHRNWRSGRKEVDIVAESEGQLVFVEVKTRKNRLFGAPEEAVNDRKIRRIVSAADTYVKRYEIDLPVRYDIITVVGEEPPFAIDHIEQAFLSPIW